MIVLDASAVVELLLLTPAGVQVAERYEDGARAHFPELMPVEALAALRRLSRAGSIDESRALQALRDLSDLPGHRHRHGLLLADAFRLATRFSSYDAVYVALARLLDATLVTCDAPLARQAATIVDVELVRAPAGRSTQRG